MSARLVEIIIPDARISEVCELVSKHSRRFWQEKVPGDLEKFSCIVQQRYVERLLESLNARFENVEEFSALVVALNAVLPPVLETADTRLPLLETQRPPSRLEEFFSRERLSTDELYDDIEESVELRPTYLLTVILSAVIAALGMRSGQTAVVIGAMVIAPFLGPAMGIAMAGTVGNWLLGRRAATTLAVGVAAALLASFVAGFFVEIDPTVPELLNRSVVQPSDVALALASGAAGVLAFSRGSGLALVGVMIAVALVPPIAAAGLFFSQGLYDLGWNALFLFGVNFVSINVAGIVMFLVQGLPPKSWRMTSGILMIWAAILSLFVAMIVGRVAFGLASMEFANHFLNLLN